MIRQSRLRVSGSPFNLISPVINVEREVLTLIYFMISSAIKIKCLIYV